MRPPSRFGSIQLEFHFNEEQRTLNCNVISGKDLLACDLNGLSNPYVLVELRNVSSGERRGLVKSPVKYKTLNPNFMFDVGFDLREFGDTSRWRLKIELW